jgi:hypothetical protein
MLAGVLPGIGAQPASAASSDCPNTSWQLTQEVALFKGTATAIPGGVTVTGAPRVQFDKLYKVELIPAERVALAASSKPSQRHDVSAGILAVDVVESGTYRVSMDGPFWVEAIGPDGPITSSGFQGHQVCSSIHKVVEFPLRPGRISLQISGASPTISLTVTRSAADDGRAATQ